MVCLKVLRESKVKACGIRNVLVTLQVSKLLVAQTLVELSISALLIVAGHEYQPQYPLSRIEGKQGSEGKKINSCVLPLHLLYFSSRGGEVK